MCREWRDQAHVSLCPVSCELADVWDVALFAKASLVQVLPVASANAFWWQNSEFATQLSCPSSSCVKAQLLTLQGLCISCPATLSITL